MKKNLKVLYFSPTDNTAKIVRAIAKGFDANEIYEALPIRFPEAMDLKPVYTSDDILIVGVPVYAGRVPSILLPFFDHLKGNNALVVLVAVYGNRDYEDALLELTNIFENNGFIAVGAGAFVGEHSYTDKVGTGRPDLSDLAIAHKFGSDIAKKISKLALGKLTVGGNYPYKERRIIPPMGPETSDACNHCGLCAKLCPVHAISQVDYKTIEKSLCVRCHSCVRCCPVHAKSFNSEAIVQITQSLIDHCSMVRHEPKLFIE